MVTIIGIATLALISMMTVLWVIAIRTNNASIVDVGWGLGFMLVALISFALLDGVVVRKILMTGMITLWGTRLALHLLFDRILSGKPEDGRYQDMRRKWHPHTNFRLFVFFQTQAVLIVLLSIPFMLVMMNDRPTLSILEYVGAIIWMIGLIGEAIADRQLKTFKNQPELQGQVCQVGLWRYTRHPNYFFEWIIWVGYAIVALPSPRGWIGLVSAVFMLYVLLKVTGIRITEKQALRTKGEAYREYQRTTSPFVPWFRKS